MLTPQQADDLGKQLAVLNCTNLEAADGLFLFVFKGEPEDEDPKYRAHLSECDHCKIAVQVYRYQRDVARLLSRGREPDENP
jgi:hypothetical protein